MTATYSPTVTIIDGIEVHFERRTAFEVGLLVLDYWTDGRGDITVLEVDDGRGEDIPDD